MTSSTSLSVDKRRELGAFDTVGNPFTLEPFVDWLSDAGINDPILEPFAGNGAIPRLIGLANLNAKWASYDLEPRDEHVTRQDTLREFPTGFRVVISNPPYLSYHFAKRKGVAVSRADFKGYPSLYLVAIEQCLKNCEYVALIVPDSFITSGLHRERLSDVVSLSSLTMFAETTMPTCLALWKPSSSRTRYWLAEKCLGNLNDLQQPVQHDKLVAKRISFNVLDGNLGLWAIDGTSGPGIRFCMPSEIPEDKIKHSARLVSRIMVRGLSSADATELIEAANHRLSEWRNLTGDALLTAFKGPRDDGRFRRRIDFKNARAILASALAEVEDIPESQISLRLD
jgi:hypothetical protein